ncbi:hypothetical protein VNI00_009931 [Paramarasmius palmivorus]|uniref:Uncharacterized protein n=1 Tax=Paramarasmius palmivorus TaxID=297713 RepID=A0AAW0CMP5_9AGAR
MRYWNSESLFQRIHDTLKTLSAVIMSSLPTPHPDFADTLPTQTVLLVHTAIRALSTAFGSVAGKPELLVMVNRHWSQIWDWMPLLYDTFLNTRSTRYRQFTHSDTSFCDDLHLSLLTILNSLARESSTASTLLSNPVFSLMVDLLLLATQPPSFGDFSEPLHRNVLSMGTALFKLMSNYPDRAWNPIISEVFDRTPTHFASGILGRIIENTLHKDQIPDYEVLEFSLRALCWSKQFSPPFRSAFIQRRSIFWVCNVMKWMSRQEAHCHGRERLLSFYLKYLRLCTDYLVTTILDKGQTAALEALEAGILESISFSAYILDEETRRGREDLRSLVRCLLRILLNHTMYHSVCAVFAKHFHRANKSVCACISLCPDFTEIEKVVEDRVAKKHRSFGDLDSRDQLFQEWMVDQYIEEQHDNFLAHQAQYRLDNPSLSPDDVVISMLNFDSEEAYGHVIDSVALMEIEDEIPKEALDALLADERIKTDPLVLTSTHLAGRGCRRFGFGHRCSKHTS